MNIKTLKNIMKEVNQPNEFIMEPVDLTHPLYWIWRTTTPCRLKTLDSRLSSKRHTDARFDVFVWGGYIAPRDYKFEQIGQYFHIKFIRENFPSTIENSNDPNFGQPWSFEAGDNVKIEGDLEILN
jgi:hypothetical protein